MRLLVVDLDKQAVVDKHRPGRIARRRGASPRRQLGRGRGGDQQCRRAGGHGDQGKREATIKVEGKNPEHAVFSPDGKWIFVSAEEATQVDIIDIAQRKQVANVPVGRRPRGHRLSAGQQQGLRRLRAGQHGVRDRRGQSQGAQEPQGRHLLQRRGGATRRQARLHLQRQGRHRLRDRHARPTSSSPPSRSASAPGTWPSRPTARSSTLRPAAPTRCR